MHSDEHVHQVEKITSVVEDDPSDGKDVLQFPENSSPEDERYVV